jgi:hypothetical protein
MLQKIQLNKTRHERKLQTPHYTMNKFQNTFDREFLKKPHQPFSFIHQLKMIQNKHLYAQLDNSFFYI